MTLRPGIADHPARVLIVDDERKNRELLEVMLAPEGLLLQTAASGEEALAMVARERPDLILLDIMMPGMDGYQVAASIKGDAATSNIPVIMVTALEERDARMRGLQAGVEEFLTNRWIGSSCACA
jgi:CheY-like chemotaxis protein